MDNKLIDFIYELQGARTAAEAWDVWAVFLRSLGATHSVYGYSPVSDSVYGEDIVVFSTMSESWMQHYLQSNYADVDITVPHCQQRLTPVATGLDLEADNENLSAACVDFIHDVADEGGRSGKSFPLRDRRCGGWGGVSFLSDMHGEEFLRHMSELERLLPIAANYFHDQIQILLHDEYAVSIRLSPKERECLLLLSEYRTTQEIAHILGITTGTVYEYLGNARRKLNVSTTTHAVAKAILQELIKK